MRDPQGWRASLIRAGELRNSASGPAPAGPLPASPRSARIPLVAFSSHLATSATAPRPAPPPSANSWAPRLPALTDFESVPCLPLRSSTISPGRGISSPLSLRARLLHAHDGQCTWLSPPRCASLTHQSVPTKGPETGTPALPGIKTSDSNSQNPSREPNF